MPNVFQRLGAALRGNPLDNPAVPLNQAGFLATIFGGTQGSAGVVVNEKTAMAHATVYACVRVLSSIFSTLPCKAYSKTSQGRKPALDSDLQYLVGVEPNPYMSASTFWAAIMACVALRGNGYAIIQRDPKSPGGVPIAMWPVHPGHVQPRINAEKDLEYVVTIDAVQKIYKSDDMLHVRGLTLDGLIGLDPITTAARESISTGVAGARHIGGFFGRGSRPSGLLTRPVPQGAPGGGTMPRQAPEENDKARSSWEMMNGGENQGRTAVLPPGWKWEAVALTPEQSQYLQIRQFERTEICAVFYSVPPHLVGDTSRLSNSNHESQMLEFQKISMLPLIVSVEGELNRKVVPKVGRNASLYEVRFDATELTRGDFDAMMTGFATGRQWGLMTANECRAALGLDPIAGPAGEEVIIPLNMVLASKLADEPEPQSTPDPDAEPGSDPAKTDDGDPQPKGNGGQNQRLLERMEAAYRTLFRDAAGRLMQRSVRSTDTIQQTFGAVLSSIAEESVRQARQTFSLSDDVALDAEKQLRECAKQIERRSAAWTATTADADADDALKYCVRALLTNIFRDAGSTLAQG